MRQILPPFLEQIVTRYRFFNCQLSLLQFGKNSMNQRDYYLPKSWEQLFSQLFEKQFSERSFAANFGASPAVCTILWACCQNQTAFPITAEHLLWTLNFLKCYETMDSMAAKFRCAERSLRTWIWIVGEVLDQQLKEVNISWYQNVLMTVWFQSFLSFSSSLFVSTFFIFFLFSFNRLHSQQEGHSRSWVPPMVLLIWLLTAPCLPLSVLTRKSKPCTTPWNIRRMALSTRLVCAETVSYAGSMALFQALCTTLRSFVKVVFRTNFFRVSLFWVTRDTWGKLGSWLPSKVLNWLTDNEDGTTPYTVSVRKLKSPSAGSRSFTRFLHVGDIRMQKMLWCFVFVATLSIFQ